jgi:hypothetical protein
MRLLRSIKQEWKRIEKAEKLISFGKRKSVGVTRQSPVRYRNKKNLPTFDYANDTLPLTDPS